MDLVDETLKEWRQHNFEWGQWDCILSMSRHFARMGAPDATERFRGTYHSQEGGMAIVEAHGGMKAAMEVIGGEPVEGWPQRGDAVGFVPNDGSEMIAALCTGDGVVIRLERGVIELPLRLVEWDGVWRARVEG